MSTISSQPLKAEAEFGASLVYMVSSRISRATQRNHVSKNKQNNNTKKTWKDYREKVRGASRKNVK